MKGEYNVTVKVSFEFDVDILTGESDDEVKAEQLAREQVIKMYGLDDENKPTSKWGYQLETDAVEYEN